MPKAIVVADRWTPGTFMANNEKVKDKRSSVDCLLLGNLAIHHPFKTDEDGKLWCLASVTTGFKIIRSIESLDEMKRIGEHCHDTWPEAWKLRDPKAVVKALPKWIGKWLRACWEDGKFLDPSTYEAEHQAEVDRVEAIKPKPAKKQLDTRPMQASGPRRVL
jgi:hypothetical protein